MKRLLVVLTGLVGITTSSVSTIATVAPTKVESQMITWPFAEQNYNEYLYGVHPFKFSIDNINLTAMGIPGTDQLHNNYKEITIPGLRITFGNAGSPQVVGDTWYTDRREIGDEDWTRGYQGIVSGRKCIVESAATLWYSGSGNFMMRLSYQLSCLDGINVSIQTGSALDFS